MKKKNILLVRIVNKNLGDTVIYDCTRYLIDKICKENKLDINIIPFSLFNKDFTVFDYIDAVIFAGGGLIKFKNEDLWQPISSIVRYADSKQIPVYFNSVGVEGYDDNDERCQELKNIINLPFVKGISIRDDYELFVQNYKVREDLEVTPVCDPAVWVHEAYNIQIQKKGVIGIGVGRKNLFSDYGMTNISDDYLKEFYKELIHLLEQEGYKWKFFTNGLNSDELFVDELIEYLELENQQIRLERPIYTKDLIENIASFDAIVATRMHSNIIAYSLGIPSIGLVWNNKLSMWGSKIGYENRFFDQYHIDAKTVFKRLKESLCEGVTTNEEFKNSINIPLQNFLVKISRKERNINHYKWNNKMTAIALGGANYIYKDLNSYLLMEEYYKQGTKNFETDIRLISDNRIVCINGWNEKNKIKLSSSSKKMKYKTFMNKRYESSFPTTDLNYILKFMKKNKDTKFIFDIGKPNNEELDILLNEFEKCLDKHFSKFQLLLSQLKRRILFRIQDIENYCIFENYQFSVLLDYKSSMKIDEYIQVLNNYKIKWSSIEKSLYNEELINRLIQEKKKIYIFTTDNLSQIIQYYDKVNLIGTHFQSVELLNMITNS